MDIKVKSGTRTARISDRPGFPLAAGLLVAIFLVLGSMGFAYLERQRYRQEERLVLTNRLGILRAHLEGALNSRLLLGRGLVSYVALHPAITHEAFQNYAGRLVGQDPIVRNIALIKNTTIVDAYPLRGNEKAIGVDLAKIPAQQPAIQRVIDTRKPAVDGPLNLVQGGRGLIHRIPVLLDIGTPREAYWGQVSVVLIQEALLAEANLEERAHGLRYALRKRGNSGVPGELFWGQASVFQQDPVILDVVFPNGAWQLAAAPEQGWGAINTAAQLMLLIGGATALVAGYLVFRILGAARRIHTLENILPICANCKKIRDDQGYWEQVESYLATASDIRFSHGLCPDCAKKLYELDDEGPQP